MQKYIQKALHISGLLAAVFIFVGIAYAINFTHPGSSPTGGNVAKPINVGSASQVKEGGLTLDELVATGKITGENQICIGNDCKSAWPGGNASQFSTACQIHTLTIAADDDQPGVPHNNTRITRDGLAQNCNSHLTQEEKDLGFMMVSFDNCPGVSGRDCSGASYCKYIRFECDAGITFRQGSFSIGDPSHEPACRDGRDNDGDGLVDMDDIGCDYQDDPSEENDPGQQRN